MIRILIAIGSLLLEVATALSEGALALSMMTAGVIVTVLHLTMDSHSFQRIVNWMTGCDLPETLDPIPTQSPDDQARA